MKKLMLVLFFLILALPAAPGNVRAATSQGASIEFTITTSSVEATWDTVNYYRPVTLSNTPGITQYVNQYVIVTPSAASDLYAQMTSVASGITCSTDGTPGSGEVEFQFAVSGTGTSIPAVDSTLWVPVGQTKNKINLNGTLAQGVSYKIWAQFNYGGGLNPGTYQNQVTFYTEI